MPGREIDDGMHVAKQPQPNTVLVKLSDHIIKIFLLSAKNNCGSVMTRHTVISLLMKTLPL